MPLDKTQATNLNANNFEAKMLKILSNLGLGHWKVHWHPEFSSTIRGKVVSEKLVIEIYDSDVESAWDTFIHEVVESKLRSVLRPYRVLVNKLLEGYQEIADAEKDRFIEELNEVFHVALDSPPSS